MTQKYGVDKPVLFSATWCSACKPVKAWVETNNVDIDIVDVDLEPDVVSQFSLRSVPTLVHGDKFYVTNTSIIEYLGGLNG